MDNKTNVASSILDSVLSKMVQHSFFCEGKLILEHSGKILFSNLENLLLDIENNDNFMEYLSSKANVYSDVPILLADDNTALDIEFSTKNESQHYRLTILPIQYETRTLFVAQIFCITESKQALQRLENRKKSVENELQLRTREIVLTKEAMAGDGGYLRNFMRGLRHDLISPITQLKEIIAFYQKTTDPIKKKQAAELINQSLQKLSNTATGVSEFVDAYIAQSDKREVVDLQLLFDETCATLESEILDKEAVMSFNLDHKKEVFFTLKLLQSVVYNLISNAIKFRSKDRNLTIDISTYDSPDGVNIEIKDNGIGIDLEKYGDKLFQPFKRLTTDRQGAGIGLSLVHNILDKNDGSIKLESELGKFTKVIVFLPSN